ncbi:MAG: tetratricopeptide repeat protein [Phycisphaerae bacterium]
MRQRAMIGVLAMGALSLGCVEHAADVKTQEIRSTDAKVARDVRHSPPAQILPRTYFASGQMLERQGNETEAIAQYEKAIAADPRFGSAYNRLGILHQKLDQLGDAEKTFINGINAVPASATLRNNLGLCYWQQGLLREAEAQFRAAIQLDAESQRAHGNLAILLARDGRTDESYREFSQVVSPETAYTNVGILRLEMGDPVAAGRLFQMALDRNPRCPGAAEGLRRATRLAKARRAQPPPAETTTLAGRDTDEP